MKSVDPRPACVLRVLFLLVGAAGGPALPATPAAGVAVDELSGLWCSVAAAGDFDGDGTADLALAGRTNGPQGFGDSRKPRVSDVGRIWILSGRDGSHLSTLEPPVACADFGYALAGAPDGEGPGFLAVLGGGRAWIFSGTGGHAVVELAAELGGAELAPPIAVGADVDGDGHPDVALHARRTRRAAVRAPLAELAMRDPDRRGAALVCSGLSGRVLAAHGCGSEPSAPILQGLWRSVEAEALLGPLALLEDRDGDGRGELALALGGVSVEGVEGMVEAIELRSVVGGEVFLRAPVPSGTYPPWLLASHGDVDGDGRGELLYSRVNEHVLVLSGATGETLHRHDYAGGYLHGEGTSLQSLPDLDGDTVRDYLIAANEDGLDCDEGFLAIRSGAGNEAIHFFGPKDDVHDGQCGIGVDACAVGDVDGDGKIDLAVHMPRLREARVLSGASFEVLWRVDIANLPGASPR